MGLTRWFKLGSLTNFGNGALNGALRTLKWLASLSAAQ